MARTGRPRRSLSERFWPNVLKTEYCWDWTSGANKQGYGKVTVDGKTAFSHRASWILHFGPIPHGMMVCHKCDRPCCVNPDHLFLGTAKANMADRDAKGRAGDHRGEKHGMSKLSGEDILEIRRLSDSGVGQRAIADVFGLSQQHVSDIVTRKKWSHL